ncbi:fad-dependent thymidylate synthase : Thymidylate synthase ThyX OS=Frankia symbiont subsp. Datisca glomerata GN=thyX PE=3 SV=1: Thy1 [Gemmata massiliana]|uniref:Flavin-dependent thymidylate synthase n=1 Tax=Gemmata massiliana TaxID=1210884 RepID=A0A6P2DLD9_9BACT|nr:fad-dependent thymidylate synthase : Thymidylate synthase ThyX OS=Frankia symbiont subsp. Datisca glomerata GN=thyX PE=3 SV=1: Thy1 [Gemmata massiliana]
MVVPIPHPTVSPVDTGIRVITEPSVYVLGKQTVDDAELDRFLADHGVSWESDSEVAGEVLTETAGRVCYMSFAKPRPGGNAAYLTHIKEVGHGSVLEHAVWNLLLTGVSRSLTHELVRHRAGFGFSQLSQRYVDESVAEYVEPDIIANDPELHAIWLETVKQSHAAYVKLAEALNTKLADPAAATAAMLPANADRTTRRKTARQAARSVLPNATETKIFITANARALRHFFEQRGSAFAEPEIRKLAGAILDVLQKDAPNLFGDYQKVPLPDGTFELTTQFKKV